MSANGKHIHFTRNDLFDVGARFDVPHGGREIICWTPWPFAGRRPWTRVSAANGRRRWKTSSYASARTQFTDAGNLRTTTVGTSKSSISM